VPSLLLRTRSEHKTPGGFANRTSLLFRTTSLSLQPEKPKPITPLVQPSQNSHAKCWRMNILHHPPSLPPRGAWIETNVQLASQQCRERRSPHGGRGLKHRRGHLSAGAILSLPPRGAWIETGWRWRRRGRWRCRSPHGGRGLKHRAEFVLPPGSRVAPPTGGVD
jgi:hypothetical protein